MTTQFNRPMFGGKGLELRCGENEVCIYGTQAGLSALADLILDLVNNPKRGHIHLEDYELLTEKSLIGAVAIFDD